MLFYAGIFPVESRWRVSVGLLIALQFQANVLEFTLTDERVASLNLRVEEWVLNVVCAYVPNSSSVYPPFLEYLKKVL